MSRRAWLAVIGACVVACGSARTTTETSASAVPATTTDDDALVADATPDAGPPAPPGSDAQPDAAAAPDPEPSAATDATDPSETPPAPSIAVADLPRGDPRTVAPLSHHADVQLRSALRLAHHARARLVDTIFLVAPDGSARVLALYDYSLWEACVAEHDGAEGARRQCIESLDEQFNIAVGDAARHCTAVGLARMDFAPPAAGETEATGHGAFDDVALPEHCQLERANELAVRDVDLDGATEIVLDVTMTTPNYHFRGETSRARDTRGRYWIVLREDDMQEQGRITRFYYDDNDDITYQGSAASRFELRDTDGDGRADLVVDTIQWAGYGPARCVVPDTGAWTGTCPGHDARHVVRRFSRAHDVWVEPDES